MKKITVLIVCLLSLSCGNSTEKHLTSIDELYPIIDKIESCDKTNGIRNIRLYIIDSCEYIGYINNFREDFLTHKGNCRFCAVRLKTCPPKNK